MQEQKQCYQPLEDDMLSILRTNGLDLSENGNETVWAIFSTNFQYLTQARDPHERMEQVMKFHNISTIFLLNENGKGIMEVKSKDERYSLKMLSFETFENNYPMYAGRIKFAFNNV